jgi:hypothetical protein
MMPFLYHQDMRTTLTLDEDVASKLKSEVKRSGCSFKQVVNEYLRLGLHAKKQHRTHRRFRVKTRDLGELRAGLNLDNIGELLERLEGSTRR